MTFRPATIPLLRFWLSQSRSAPCLLLCLCLVSTWAPSQDVFLPLRFKHLTVDVGLPDHTVNQIIQDNLGFIWLATTNGLSRFDGYTYTNFRHNIHQESSLTSNMVHTVFQDKNQVIWVGTDSGLNCLDPNWQGFRHYHHDENDPNSLEGDDILSIYEDNSGLFWIGTATGLDRLDRASGTIKPYGKALNPTEGNPVAGRIFFINEDHKKNLWVGSNTGLAIYDRTKDIFINLPLIESDIFVKRTNDPSVKLVDKILESAKNTPPPTVKKDASGRIETPAIVAQVWSFFRDSTDLIWMGTSSGLVSFNPNNVKSKIYPNIKQGVNGPQPVITSIAEDSSGLLWLASRDNGLTLFDRREQEFYHYTHNPGDPSSLSANGLNSVLKDRSGLMWVGTEGGGLNLWDPLTKVFLNYTHVPGDKTSLDNEVPWSFMELNDGTLWIGTDGGLNRWHYGTREFENVLHDPDRPDSISEGPVYAIDKCGEDRLWLGILFDLDLYDPKTKKATRFSYDKDRPKGFPEGQVTSLYAVQDEKVWVGMFNEGLFLFDGAIGETVVHYKPDSQTSGGLTNDDVKCIAPAQDGHLWIGTPGGLYHFEQEKQEFQHYGENPDGTGLSAKMVMRVFEDEHAELWIGTGGGGLNRRRPDGQFTYYTTREGLADDTIISLGNDRNGMIWMGTVRGLIRLDPTTEQVRNFEHSQGLQSNEFNEGAFYRDHAGKLYFGGGKGFSVFNPDEIIVSTYTPPIYISSILLFNEPYKTDVQVPLLQQLDLAYTDTVLTVGFSSLDYTNPQNNRYQYLLEGLNNEWISLGSRNSATFTSLKSGNYTLHVKGSNSDGQWNGDMATLAIHIETPPWFTPLAWLCYFAICAISGWLWYRAIKKREALAEASHKAVRDSEERLKNALWGTGDELWDWTIKTGTVHRSNMLAVRDTEKYHHINSVFELMHPDDVDATRDALQSHLDGKIDFYEACYRLPNEDGEWAWILDRGRIVERDKDGKALRIAGTNKDITHLKLSEEKFKLIAKAFENTSDGVVITNTDFAILAINPAYTQITGYKAEQIEGSVFPIRGQDHDDTLQVGLVKEALLATGHWQGELWQQHIKGGRFPVSSNLDVVLDQRGQATHYVCVFTDISLLKNAEKKMENLANFDQLTALPNRTLFHDRFSHAISLASREGKKVGLLYLDLDRFKNVNDSLGHAAGDQLLQAAANRVRSCLQEEDSMARLGGDEFTVILEGIQAPGDLAAIAENILRAMDRPYVLLGEQLVVSPSIGISLFPFDGHDSETLLKCADTAMFHAKRLGGNNYQFFTQEMNREVVERLNIENQLRRSLENEEFLVYYQPKLDIRLGQIIGWEALVRWKHPQEGMIPPVRFIPIAEETGIIVPLGLWVLRRACLDAAQWHREGREGCKVAVNLSAKQFVQEDLVDCVIGILDETGLPASLLELEITESTLLNNIDNAVGVLLRFRELGITLALDDFGTGFSSLGYLKRLPIQTLKIDRSFVQDVTEDPEDASIVATIIDLAHNLNISVVAEGVEREDQLAFLKDRGCEMAQGYLFSRPIPFEEASAMLSNNEFPKSFSQETLTKP